VYEDLRDILNEYISSYTRPENNKAIYIYNGKKTSITRRRILSEKLSQICDEIFNMTPVINNEVINRNEITNTTANSRNKIIAGLIRSQLDPDLGLTGTGQEVSIMRSLLVNTGVLINDSGVTLINTTPNDTKLANMLSVIECFITQSSTPRNISELFELLTSEKLGIGVRRGIIPIYISAVLHNHSKEVVISDQFGQVPFNLDTMIQMSASPELFTLKSINWDDSNEIYLNELEEIFSDYIVSEERHLGSYDYIVTAMHRWYLSLPKYTRESNSYIDVKKINKRYMAFIKLFKKNVGSTEFLFERVPEAFGYSKESYDGVAIEISSAKDFFDKRIDGLINKLIDDIKYLFSDTSNMDIINKKSLTSVIEDWCESLNPLAFEQLFGDGTEVCLNHFKTVTNDENTFTIRLAKIVTDLRVQDWDDNTYSQFMERLSAHKLTAEEFVSGDVKDTTESDVSSTYQLTFLNDNGEAYTRRFSKVEESKRGKLLFNQIISALDSMGQSISEQEKRQILMEILKKMC